MTNLKQNKITDEQQSVNEGGQKTPVRKPSKIIPIILVVFLILISITVAIYFFNSYKKQAQEQVLQSNFNKLQKEFTQQQLTIDQLQKAIHRLPHLSSNLNLLTQVYDLIKLANTLLITENNVKEALRLLTIANNLLSNDAQFGGLKLALAKDIAHLQQVPMIDSESLLLHLENLKQKITDLNQVAVANGEAPTIFTNIFKPDQRSFWQRILFAMTQALKNVIHIDQQQVAPFLPPKQLANLRVNLQSEILQAQWALMQGQGRFYKTCLQESVKWISNYFPKNDARVTEILKEMQELANVNVPQLINVNSSLMAAQKILKSITTSPIVVGGAE